MSDEPEILCEIRGSAGFVLLNRPKALNALNLSMVRELARALDAWERAERPLTEHTQRISWLLGLPTTWPPSLRAKALALAGKSKWLVKQRTRTALHRPTGT